jgi:hypothetical protein
MLHTGSALHGSGQTVNMSPRKFPESPSDVGRPVAKQTPDPALFAQALAEHAGFDALAARTMTPPPRYSRIEQPRLTLQIPDEVQGDETPVPDPISLSSSESSHGDNTIPSTASSPISSPIATSPSKQSEPKLFLKVKAEVKRRGKGFRSRLRKSTSRSGSASTTPLQGSPASPSNPSNNAFAHSSSNDASPHSPCSPQIFPAAQELDSRQIDHISGPGRSHSQQPEVNGGFLSYLFSRSSDSELGIQRNASVSSIIPTPRRGLSIAAPEGRRAHTANLNAMELSGRLESLNEQVYDNLDSIVSPCSPALPTSPSGLGSLSLMRSNAVTDRINNIPDPVSPISALPGQSPPPSSPTLDGRLDFLPRLSVPQFHATHTNRNPNRSLQAIPQRSLSTPRQFAEHDYGKELVSAESSETQVVSGWYTSPSSASQQNNNSTNMIPRITIDQAANAPEVAPDQQLSAQFSRSGHPNNYIPPPQPYTGRPFQSRSPLAQLTETLWDSLFSGIIKSTELLRQSYGPDPPVPENHVRVRWTCVWFAF